jgi:hypothetical protein
MAWWSPSYPSITLYTYFMNRVRPKMRGMMMEHVKQEIPSNDFKTGWNELDLDWVIISWRSARYDVMWAALEEKQGTSERQSIKIRYLKIELSLLSWEAMLFYSKDYELYFHWSVPKCPIRVFLSLPFSRWHDSGLYVPRRDEALTFTSELLTKRRKEIWGFQEQELSFASDTERNV